MKILLAADGSDYTKSAARSLAKFVQLFKAVPQVHLLHVRPPIPYPGAAARLGKEAIEEYEREESEAALAVAEKELEKAGVAFDSWWRTGEVAHEVDAFVKENAIDMVVMGSHGHGAFTNLALGSVATKLIATLDTPVLVIR
jgi:nucleotide-binding universal stress UspA family protein